MTEDEKVGGIIDVMDMSLRRFWEISWTEEPGELQSLGSQKNQTRLNTHAREEA